MMGHGRGLWVVAGKDRRNCAYGDGVTADPIRYTVVWQVT